jgi:hypothetical protein
MLEAVLEVVGGAEVLEFAAPRGADLAESACDETCSMVAFAELVDEFDEQPSPEPP